MDDTWPPSIQHRRKTSQETEGYERHIWPKYSATQIPIGVSVNKTLWQWQLLSTKIGATPLFVFAMLCSVFFNTYIQSAFFRFGWTGYQMNYFFMFQRELTGSKQLLRSLSSQVSILGYSYARWLDRHAYYFFIDDLLCVPTLIVTQARGEGACWISLTTPENNWCIGVFTSTLVSACISS